MDVSDTSSSLAEWAQLYQHGLGPHPAATPAVSGGVSAGADSTVVTTTSSPAITGSSSSPASHPAIEGRVGKSARRRSRASRRAPTTLLNTDTTNFRAMVQQFTGIPSATYSSNYQPGNGPMTSFGLGFNDPIRQTATVMPFGHLQHQFQGQALQHQPQGQQQQQQQQIYDGSMFTVGNHERNDGVFLQGLSNPRANLEVTDGFFLETISSQMMPRPASTDSRTHGFFS
ncbi:VQ motif-containing protein 22-like [Phoenix dactylifera]|uniref:VQ motif-containing protein 22-like n=1 Tax=Phoenix dactylifera TaxID=42345 RepID=A0A8B7CJT8_PHODC|nr:VQ motif-containing protein 22-like [Phoenix dactylifera]